MAGNTLGIPGPLGSEDRLDARLEVFEVERRG
jgi:hypothetical protein